MMEQLKRYWEIAKLALLQEKAAKDSKIKGMNEHEKEFLPAVLEVTEMPPSHAARLLTYVIMLMFTVLILWSVLSKIDIIATSAGKLMPASNIKTIQTLTDSEIEEIYVQEGQYVKEGQDLIKFNQTEVLANINRVENEMEALEISVARLQALLTDNPEENFTYNKEIDEYLIKMHTDLLKIQMTEKAAKIEVLNGQITKAEKEKETIQADLIRIEKLLPSVQERIEKKRILVDKKLLARLTFLEQEEELTNLQEQRNVQAKKMAETEANIESLKKEQRQYLAEFDKNIMQELTESREKLASYQQELIKYEEALKRTIVKAPLSGYVQQLVYHTKGGVVETALSEKNGWNGLGVHRMIEVAENAGAAPTGTAYIVCARTGLRMRKRPDVRGEYMQMLPDGAVIVALETRVGWIKTTYKGYTGWVSGEYCCKAGED